MEQQKQLLRSSRRWRVEDDLGLEVRSVQNSLRSLQTLERALEGKYIDFRVSPTLDTMNFVFDRGGSALFKRQPSQRVYRASVDETAGPIFCGYSA